MDTSASPVRDGENSVLVAPIELPEHQNDLAVTVSYVDEVTGEIVEADIIINSRHLMRLLDSDAEEAAQSRRGQHDDEEQDRGPDHLQDGNLGDLDGQHEADRRAQPDGDEVGNPRVDQLPELESCRANGYDFAACDHAYDLQSVVAHEVGHFYGLGEDREKTQATMFFCTSPCETHKRSLSDSDTGALDDVYGEDPEERPEIVCSVRSAGAATPRSPLPWLAATFLGLAAILRRREALPR